MNKLRILIADDNKALAELTKKFLSKSEKITQIDIAISSREELEMIERYKPDIVITDIVRKEEDISGFDIVLECLKNKKNVKFILCTASSINEILYKYNCYKLPYNVIGYLKKPFDWDILLAEIEKTSIIIK